MPHNTVLLFFLLDPMSLLTSPFVTPEDGQLAVSFWNEDQSSKVHSVEVKGPSWE